MPTYDYECKTCGTVFEYFQTMSDTPLSHCLKSACPLEDSKKGTGEVIRLIGAGAGLVFKGSGFYITDYKSPEHPTAKSHERSDSVKKAHTGDTHSGALGEHGGENKDTKTPKESPKTNVQTESSGESKNSKSEVKSSNPQSAATEKTQKDS